MMVKKKRILVCPLDWGLGHATRCIPIIEEMLKQGADVWVGADKGPYEVLIREFPTVKFITFPGLRIKYPPGFLFIPFMFYLFPLMLIRIFKEHRVLSALIKEYNFDVVISDNRYGVWNKKVKTVFITHQVMIKTSRVLAFLNPVIFAISKMAISKFDFLWIPDVEGENNLSGDLAHSKIIENKTRFIGILSRFKKSNTEVWNYKYDLCAIISGPEPQRTIFEEMIIKEIEKTSLKAVIILGKPDKQMQSREFANGIIYPHLKKEMMQTVIEESEIIISRSGYTTIMDLAILEKKAIFIPTPGQTEQEYLAERLMGRGMIYYQKQTKFDLRIAITQAKKRKGLFVNGNYDKFSNAIIEVLGS